MKSTYIFKWGILPAIIACSLLASSCAVQKNTSYLQGIRPGVNLQLQQERPIALSPGDRLRIVVFSRDRELSDLFNLSSRGISAGGGSESSRYGLCYTVRPDGTVEIPTLGPVYVQGLTRDQVADAVRYQLVSTKLLLDPTVIVEFYEMAFYTLGEVGRQGRIEIPSDNITLLQALSMAGDLTITGRRDNILVLRTENGIQTPYVVDITNMESLYSSPVYYIKQNDIIYVEPNPKKAAQSDANASTFQSIGFWFSLPSTIVSIVAILLQLIK